MFESEITVLRVLTALAWADGQVSPEESAMLDGAAASLGLPEPEREDLARMRKVPVPLDRFEALARELQALAPSAEERRRVLAQARALVAADRSLTSEETRWLELLERILEGGEAVSLFARVRAVLTGARRDGAATAPQAQLERQVLGGLLARRILRAGGVADPAAFEEGVGRFLAATGLTSAERGEVLRIVQRNEAQDNDRQRLCASVNRITDHEGRLELLAALFAAGRLVNGGLNAVETELRLIANYLWIEPQDFVRLRARAMSPARSEEPVRPDPWGEATPPGSVA